MTTLDLHRWNFIPMEILEHVFSFLPIRDRHNVSHTCKLWATAVSSVSVWRFTEVQCISGKTDGTSRTLLQKIQPYMGHIRYFKLVVDMFLAFTRALASTILDEMARKKVRLQGLQIVCYGGSPFFYFGDNLPHSLDRLFQGMDKATMQHIDLCHMPFFLDNATILLLASSSPNLRTLLINNHALTMLKAETTVEMVRTCPKLSTLRVSYFALSQRVFQELLRPNREPFKYLELFYDGLDNDVSEDCWASMGERHPGFRLGLEFAPTVTVQKITQVLKPYLPISQLHFNAFTNMANQVRLAASLYGGTLEKLVLYSAPSTEMNLALMRLARSCPQLREIHCFFLVGQGVVEAFRHHCPHLKKYTLSHILFFSDNPPMVVL